MKKLSATERLLHAPALAAAAVAQPLFDLLAAHADLLVAHDLRPREVVVLALGLGVLLPLAWGFPVLAVGLLGRRVGVWAYGLGIAVPAAMLGLIFLEKILPVPAGLLVGLAIVVGVMVAWGAWRRRGLRAFLSVMASGLVLFPALFVLRTPVSSLVFPRAVATSGVAIPATAPVVLVIFDELPLATLLAPGDGFDAHRFPHFAALASQAHWYPYATTVAESTTAAVPAILTGRYPDRQRLAFASAYPESLFTWLGERYRLNVVEAITRLCPETLCGHRDGEETAITRLVAVARDLKVVYLHLLLPEALSHGLPAITETWRDFQRRPAEPASEDDTVAQAEVGDVGRVFDQFLANIRYEVRPALHLIHLNLPHLPWKYLPTGQEYGPLGGRFRPPGLMGERWAGDAWLVALGWQRHILQSMYADHLLGRLVARLQETGLYDRALVIVVADHGAGFQPGVSRRQVEARNRADILAVPLLIKLPGQRQAVRSERIAETVDIVPTIAAALDSPLPWEVDGRSLLAAPESEERERLLFVDRGGARERRIVTLDPAEIEATRARMASIFGGGETPLDLYRLGPFGALVGRQVASLPVASAASSLVVQLRDAWTYESIDLAGPFLPAHVTGGVVFGERPPRRLPLAVAIGGTIQSVARTFEQSNDSWAFAGMVPSSAFRDGFNQVDFYEITGTPSAPQLHAVHRRDPTRYALRRDAEGTLVGLELSADRDFLPLVPGAVAGRGMMNGIMIRGWAADRETGNPAETVLLFAADRFLATAPVGQALPARLRKKLGGSVPPDAGFEIVIPYGVLADEDTVQLFAVAGDRVSALTYHDPRQRQEER